MSHLLLCFSISKTSNYIYLLQHVKKFVVIDHSASLVEVPEATASAQNEKGRGRQQTYKGDVGGLGSTEYPFET